MLGIPGVRGSRLRSLPVLLSMLAGALAPGHSPVAAQEEFRALDTHHPLRTAGAHTTKLYEWEVQLGGRGAWSERARDVAVPFSLETGLLRNLEVGVELEPVYRAATGRDDVWGLEAFGLHGAYGFNRESWWWPAFAFRMEVAAPPGGEASRRDWGIGGRLAATRSVAGGARIHLNGGYVAASEVDGGDFWLGGIAYDLPLGLSSRLVAGDLFVEVPRDGGRTRFWAEVGARMQWSNRTVLDVGVATRVDGWSRDEENVELLLGLSRTFGIPVLTPTPPYPEPSIP